MLGHIAEQLQVETGLSFVPYWERVGGIDEKRWKVVVFFNLQWYVVRSVLKFVDVTPVLAWGKAP